MTGIDISRHQTITSWAEIASDPQVDFVIMRSSLGARLDDKFLANWSASRQAGIIRRGMYHYIVTEVPILDQADTILRVTKGDFGSEPLTLDVERRADEKLKPFDSLRYSAYLKILVDTLKPHAYNGLRIYSNKYEWEAMTLGADVAWAAEFELHIAGYPTDPASTTYKPLIPKPWKTWAMWQYTEKGQVAGIDGNVDLNFERTTALEKIRRYAGAIRARTYRA